MDREEEEKITEPYFQIQKTHFCFTEKAGLHTISVQITSFNIICQQEYIYDYVYSTKTKTNNISVEFT